MPRYQVTLDGKTFILEGDHPPSEAEARAAIGPQTSATAAPAAAQPSMAASVMADNPALPWEARAGQALARLVSAHPVAAGATIGGALASGGTSLIPQMALGALGAAGGAGYGLLAKGAQTGDYGTPTGNAETMAKEGALAAIGQGVGAGVQKVGQGAAKLVYKTALRPSIPLQREYGDIAATGLQGGFPVSAGGADAVNAAKMASAQQARDMIAAAGPSAAPVRVVTEVGKDTIPIVQRADLRAATGLPNESGAIVGRIKAMQAANPQGIDLPRAQQMKGELQDLASQVYRAQDRGAAVTDLGADTNAAMARGLRQAIEQRVPGVGPVNARTQDLMGLQHAIENAGMRNVPGVGSIRSLLGDFMPATASVGAIAGDRASAAAPSFLRALITALGGDQ